MFSITDSGADAKLLELYKTTLRATRSSNTNATYLDSVLKDKDGATVNAGLKVSSFSQGLTLRNGTYFAFKLNGNCTTNETYIYSPATPNNRSAKNSCGLIFFDVNGQDFPNLVGIDQYIIAIGRNGIK